LYGLKPVELEVFYDLARRGSAGVDDVSHDVERDRTTTHRCLSKLLSAGLVYRQTKGLKEGGYYHLYSPVETSKIKEQSRLRVAEIAESLQRLVDNFETDLGSRVPYASQASPSSPVSSGAGLPHPSQ